MLSKNAKRLHLENVKSLVLLLRLSRLLINRIMNRNNLNNCRV